LEQGEEKGRLMILRSQLGDGLGCEPGEGEGEGAVRNWRCEDMLLILASRKGNIRRGWVSAGKVKVVGVRQT
jgi:hypothetical protein